MTVFLVKLFSRLAAAPPIDYALASGRFWGWLVGSVLRIRRKVVVDQLQLSFPEKSPAEIQRIATQVYKNQGMIVIEMLRTSVHGLDDLEGRITVVDQGDSDVLNPEKPGGLMLMAHVGNWELCGYSTQLAKRWGTVVVKPIKNPALQEHLRLTREKMHLKMLPHRGAFRDCLKALKSGDDLAIVLDQNRSREDGVFVDFFGRPACTTIGLAVISYQTKMPVHPLFCMRKNNREFTLIIGKPIEVPPNRKIETLTEYTQKYTRAIEDIIREYPDQWLWLHKRWKTQPEEAEPEVVEAGVDSGRSG